MASFEEANQEGKIPEVLRVNLKEALAALHSTQSDFTKLASASSNPDTARVFFDDLSINYDEVLQKLAYLRKSPANTSVVVNASLSPQSSKKESYGILTMATLRPLEANVLAYNTAAESASLTFDLKVTSTPAGAHISYWRRGDPSHQNYSEPTTALISSLPLAKWFFRLEKPGYKPAEREYNPYQSSEHVLHVDLVQ